MHHHIHDHIFLLLDGSPPPLSHRPPPPPPRPVDGFFHPPPLAPVTGKGLAYRSSLHCLVTIAKEEGVMALWRGFALNYARMCPWSLTFFLSFEQLRRVYGLSSF